MSDAPDLDDIARRYLDLWQQHLTQAANDPDLAAGMSRLAALMAPQGLAGWPLTGHDEAGTDGPAAAGAASGGSGRDLDKLADRLDALEKRMDALERKSGSGRKRASAGSRKPKP